MFQDSIRDNLLGVFDELSVKLQKKVRADTVNSFNGTLANIVIFLFLRPFQNFEDKYIFSKSKNSQNLNENDRSYKTTKIKLCEL